jgi:hypothetical protein
MTKNLIELSGLMLGKFRGATGDPVTGRLSQPQDLAEEMALLRDLDFGGAWVSSSGVKACDYSLRGSRYIALALVLPSDQVLDLERASDGSIQPIEVVGSIYLFLANKLGLASCHLDPLWVEEHIAGPAATDDGVPLDVIKGCLSGATVFRIHDESVFRGHVSSSYIANYLCTFDPRLTQGSKLNAASLEIVREIFLQERYYLIERNLFEAIAAPAARHAFLEVYRTLEFVFVLPRARSLLQALRDVGGTIELNVLDFARHCNRQLGWKRVERDAIGKIFREFFGASRGAYENLVLSCGPFQELGPVPAVGMAPNDSANFVEKVAERYYQLRNQVAHQFWADEETQCVDEDWRVVIEFSLHCIKHLYEQHLSAPLTAVERHVEVV